MSPSRYGSENVECKYSATEVFPQPAGPVMTQICLCCECHLERAVVWAEADALSDDIFEISVAGSEGGVGGKFC